jgi:glycine/D-amino acid oxidase-like deaminating enzyme/nitrite reductase/ring-hydroxylating ferredoxin subunit
MEGMPPATPSPVRTTTGQASLWLVDVPHTRRPALEGSLDVDVAVIGGGIAGITTALLLKREGARVAVLEAGEVASGVSGCNTAKVSALQQTVYSKIRSRHGEEGAAAYAEASLAGVELVAILAAEVGIDCDLHRRPAFTIAADASELSAVEREADAARAAGIAVTVTEDVDLPYPVAGALRLDDQLEFHPVRYVRGLADAVDGDGSLVFERSRVLSVAYGSPSRVHTGSGTVTADHVVVATHYPMLDRGLYFARLEPKRSHCIAARVRGPLPQGMSITAGSATRSIRSYGDLLVVGGEGHTTGASKATPERYQRLERFARRHWDVAEITHRWSAQDPVPHDHLPVIGHYMPTASNLYVSSGFMKWGLSGATMAAIILRDLIAGRDNPWASRFDPMRLSYRSAPKLVQMNAKVALEFVGDRARPALQTDADNLPRGEARIVRDGRGKKGVYRDDTGALHAVSLRCTHLGCLLRFNGAERSWDCPCHGSRFGADGRVLEGPATVPLEPRQP